MNVGNTADQCALGDRSEFVAHTGQIQKCADILFGLIQLRPPVGLSVCVDERKCSAHIGLGVTQANRRLAGARDHRDDPASGVRDDLVDLRDGL